MKPATYQLTAITLLLVLAAAFGLQRPARAGDAGAVLGGILAGVLVYELLDDDDDCYTYTRYYYRAPAYYPPPRYRTWSYGYYCAPPIVEYRYYEVTPRGYCYEGPRYSFRARRAPSHAERDVAPPPLYRKDGKYSPPPRYYK